MNSELTEEQKIALLPEVKLAKYMLHEDTIHISIINDELFDLFQDCFDNGFDEAKITNNLDEGLFLLLFKQGLSISVQKDDGLYEAENK
ncbi:MAG: hypothetical protein GPJ52_02830 [Candidatus Heimdallarchaeota archaeon]|nr:hypothetical protein [Candidatus Heimdallarchaeota archaeon]